MESFTPAPFPSSEIDWPCELAKLSLDTNVVFTKQSLLEFLRVIGVTVDVNNKIIAKMPRYAKFGTLSAEHGERGPQTPESIHAEQMSQVEDKMSHLQTKGMPQQSKMQTLQPDETSFRPSCRVGSAPGGKDSMKGIFGSD